MLSLLAILAPGCGGSDLLIQTVVLDPARVALPYEATLAATDAEGALTWTLDGGELPPGLDLDADGLISGTATTSGTWDFSVLADDGDGDDIVDLEITVPKVVLMSGFEPFGGYDTNPSWEAASPLDEVMVADLDVRVIELPVVWDESWDLLSAEIARLSPSVVIGTGMANGYAYRLETLAVNVEEGTDNDGVERVGEPVVEGGSDTLATMLPVDAMSQAVEGVGFDTVLSDDAGTYLCNFIFYHVVYEAQAAGRLAGFTHVPPAPYNGTMTVEDITTAHETALEALSAWLAAPSGPRPPRVTFSTPPVYFR